MARALTLFALLLLAIVGPGSGSGVADAHSGRQSYLYVSIFDDGVDGRVEMPASQLGPALDVEIPSDPAGARAAVRDLTDVIRDYVVANTALGDENGPWTIDFAQRLRILPTENGPYVVLDFVVDETFAEPPDSFIASLSVIIESDPEKDALFLIEDDWSSAVFDNEGDHLLSFSVGRTEQTVELGGASTLESMGEIRGIGSDAVRTGIDLMLIVVAVTLTAVMAIAVAGRTPSNVDIAKRGGLLLAVLLVAATPTLWLTGLVVISPGQRSVGVAVALALLASTLIAIVGRFRPVPARLVTIAVVVVGLIHGLGLGRVFVATELDRRRPVLGLVAFQFGAVVAALVVVACVAVPMLLLRRTRLATPLTLVLGAALVAYSLAWLGERVLSEDWPIEEVANPLRVWPRNLWFVAAAIAAAAIARRFTPPLAATPDAATPDAATPDEESNTP